MVIDLEFCLRLKILHTYNPTKQVEICGVGKQMSSEGLKSTVVAGPHGGVRMTSISGYWHRTAKGDFAAFH